MLLEADKVPDASRENGLARVRWSKTNLTAIANENCSWYHVRCVADAQRLKSLKRNPNPNHSTVPCEPELQTLHPHHQKQKQAADPRSTCSSSPRRFRTLPY